jgi:hypothetical protein
MLPNKNKRAVKGTPRLDYMAILMLCHFLMVTNTLQHTGHIIRHQRIKKFSHSFILFFITAWLSSSMYTTFHVPNHVYWIQMCTANLQHCICFEEIKNLTTLWALTTDTSSTPVYVVIMTKSIKHVGWSGNAPALYSGDSQFESWLGLLWIS